MAVTKVSIVICPTWISLWKIGTRIRIHFGPGSGFTFSKCGYEDPDPDPLLRKGGSEDPNPHPLFPNVDPRIRILVKMRWIRNADRNNCTYIYESCQTWFSGDGLQDVLVEAGVVLPQLFDIHEDNLLVRVLKRKGLVQTTLIFWWHKLLCDENFPELVMKVPNLEEQQGRDIYLTLSKYLSTTMFPWTTPYPYKKKLLTLYEPMTGLKFQFKPNDYIFGRRSWNGINPDILIILDPLN